jgi:hypothetical protein
MGVRSCSGVPLILNLCLALSGIVESPNLGTLARPPVPWLITRSEFYSRPNRAQPFFYGLTQLDMDTNHRIPNQVSRYRDHLYAHGSRKLLAVWDGGSHACCLDKWRLANTCIVVVICTKYVAGRTSLRIIWNAASTVVS